MRQRLTYIDHLKGISILLVVVGHFIQYNTSDSKDSGLFNFIYSFHMPLFMFISGYIGYITINTSIFKNYINFILKKGRALLIPFFAWPLIVDSLFFNPNLHFDLYGRFRDLLYDPRTGLWFLWYLFFLTILYSLFLLGSQYFNTQKSIIRDIIIFTVLLAGLIVLRTSHIIIYADSFIQYYGYFFIGVFVAKYVWLKQKILDIRYFSFFLILFLLTVGLISFNDPDFHNLGFILVIKVVTAVSAIFSIYYLVYNAVWTPWIDRLVSSWGISSLVIYATHFKFIGVLDKLPLLPEVNITLMILISLLFSLIIITFCMFIFKVVKCCPPLNLLLYGNKIETSAQSSVKQL
jgi:fucose 4-O-acetylase-like acetyltransferase